MASLCLITFYDGKIRNLLSDGGATAKFDARDSQSLIPDADEQSEGKKDIMEPDDIGRVLARTTMVRDP
ncbi:MAG: hypothetical protein ACRD47_13965 [Nitrososphaeraceae archaeon]